MVKRFFLFVLLFFTKTTQIKNEGSPKIFWLSITRWLTITRFVLITDLISVINRSLTRLMAQQLKNNSSDHKKSLKLIPLI